MGWSYRAPERRRGWVCDLDGRACRTAHRGVTARLGVSMASQFWANTAGNGCAQILRDVGFRINLSDLPDDQVRIRPGGLGGGFAGFRLYAVGSAHWGRRPIGKGVLGPDQVQSHRGDLVEHGAVAVGSVTAAVFAVGSGHQR